MMIYASGHSITIIAQATAEQSLDLWLSAAEQLDRLQYAAIIRLACRVFTVDLAGPFSWSHQVMLLNG